MLRWNVAPGKKEELKAAAARYHLDLIPTVMGGAGDPNLMEGLPVKGARFVAHHGTAALSPELTVSIRDGGFETAEGDRFTAWKSQDLPGACTFRDTAVKHGGASSLRMDLSAVPKDKGCRVSTVFPVTPFHEYRLSLWVKTEKLEAEPVSVTVRATDGDNRRLCFTPPEIKSNQDWEKRTFVFNSLDHHEVGLTLGSWGQTPGRIWWDDVAVEEVGLLNVIRRPGAPVRVVGENGTRYEEGKDYQPIRDPELNIDLPDHPQPAIHLTPRSRIKEGAYLRVSYYHPVLIEYGCSACLSEPAVFDYYRSDVKRINDELHPIAFFMQHDEIRIANWCELCQSKHMTAGQLLAENVRHCSEIIKEIAPQAKIWVWSDMFDPFHNARQHYYLVNGSYAGSWEGLPDDAGIINWAGFLGGKDFYWFSRICGHQQILSGYYDDNERDGDGRRTQAWLKAGEGLQTYDHLPGIVGAMYTTWKPDYSSLTTWAQGVWGPQAAAPQK